MKIYDLIIIIVFAECAITFICILIISIRESRWSVERFILQRRETDSSQGQQMKCWLFLGSLYFLKEEGSAFKRICIFRWIDCERRRKQYEIRLGTVTVESKERESVCGVTLEKERDRFMHLEWRGYDRTWNEVYFALHLQKVNTSLAVCDTPRLDRGLHMHA